MNPLAPTVEARTALHEATHAVVGYRLGQPFSLVTIIPRGETGGHIEFEGKLKDKTDTLRFCIAMLAPLLRCASVEPEPVRTAVLLRGRNELFGNEFGLNELPQPEQAEAAMALVRTITPVLDEFNYALGCNDDLKEVKREAKYSCGCEDELTEFLTDTWQQADVFTNDSATRRMIERVATALIERRTLDYGDVISLCCDDGTSDSEGRTANEMV